MLVNVSLMTVHLFKENGFTIKEKSQLFSLDGTTEPFPLLARIVLMVDLLFIVSIVIKKNTMYHCIITCQTQIAQIIIVVIQISLPIHYVSCNTVHVCFIGFIKCIYFTGKGLVLFSRCCVCSCAVPLEEMC